MVLCYVDVVAQRRADMEEVQQLPAVGICASRIVLTFETTHAVTSFTGSLYADLW